MVGMKALRAFAFGRAGSSPALGTRNEEKEMCLVQE